MCSSCRMALCWFQTIRRERFIESAIESSSKIFYLLGLDESYSFKEGRSWRNHALQPAVLSLDQGTYYWCQCGRSRDQPFCDGSHQGTGIEPVEFSVNEKKEVALCQCKQTKTPPFCDGTHQTL